MAKAMCMVFLATLLVVAAMAPPAEAAIGCGTVVSYLSNCLPYVTDQGPLGDCCSGIKGLYSAAQTTPDRQSVCNCLKSLAGGYQGGGVNLGKAAQLPKQCGVNIPYNIAPSTDCNKRRVAVCLLDAAKVQALISHNNVANTTAGLKMGCMCFKSAARVYSVKPEYAAPIPGWELKLMKMNNQEGPYSVLY